MARAKRTARADARRRRRAQSTTTEPGGETELESTATATTSPRGSAAGATERVGITTAFRLAFRPLDVRGDLRAFPRLAVRTKALWLPALLTVVATSLVLTIGIQGTDVGAIAANFLFTYFVFTPAIGGPFLSGFLAPRASWLFGLLIGLISAVCFSILVVGFPSSIYQAPLPDPATTRDLVISALVVSPAMGVFFASAAAWYRRFLQLSSPNRRRRNDSGRGNQSGRPGDGRTRTGTAGNTQKAGARR